MLLEMVTQSVFLTDDVSIDIPLELVINITFLLPD